MTFRPPNIPAGFGTKDTTTQEDLRRLRDVLRNLSAQMDDLQTQIDAGGGGGGGTPDPHAPTHENAGSDEIDVTGLSGVVADAQRADTIVESSGPTDLAVGAVADAEVLTRSGSTIVGTSIAPLAYATPEIWSPPETPNSNDDEFMSSSIPGGYALFKLTASTATPVTPISGVDVYTQPAADNVRIEAHKTAKRSWLLMQPRGENVHWNYSKKITLSGTNGWVFRSRIATHTHVGTALTANACSIMLTVSEDDGSGNKPAIHSASPFNASNGLQLGWVAGAGVMRIVATSTLGGTLATHTATLLTDMDTGNASTHEVVLVLTRGSLSNTWYYFLRTPNYCYFLGTATSANTGARQGDVVWVGWDFYGIQSTLPSSPILSADYLRFEETAANFLP